MTTHIANLSARLVLFVRSAIAGYEPALVRSIAVAVFVLLASFGIGTGDLPAPVEALLTFLTFIVPIAGGWLIRRKVSPVAPTRKHDALLPPNDYDGSESYNDELT